MSKRDSQSNISNPHDKLFRASMQYPEVAQDFLNTHLPEYVKNLIDFKSIELCPTTFVDEELRLSESDVLFKTMLSGQNGYIYILAEHQSTPDGLMPFRLMKYIIKIWDYHLANAKKKNQAPLPLILPLVFYTGKRQYNAPTALWEICGDQADVMHRILTEPFRLIDVNTLTESSMTSRLWSGTMEFILRYRFRQHLTEEIQKIAQNINQLALSHKNQFMVQLLSYILAVDEQHHSIQQLVTLIHDQLEPEVENKIMNLAEIIKDEGKQEGKQEKALEIAKKMLTEGIEPAFISKVTDLPLSKIRQLQNNLQS